LSISAQSDCPNIRRAHFAVPRIERGVPANEQLRWVGRTRAEEIALDSPARGDSPDDQVLMRRIAERDAAALRALYERHAPVCFAVCLRVLNDRHEAEQVLVDVFAEVWRTPARFDPERGAAAGYLAMMARSRAIDHARANKQLPTRALNDADSGISDVSRATEPGARSLAEEQRRAVQGALSTLSEPQREAVELAFYSGLTHTEIAARLEKPIGTVKTQIRQGLLRMRDALRDYWKAEQDLT
jgi:RNA polymerase sigma-70 factor (ECF subfamily)